MSVESTAGELQNQSNRSGIQFVLTDLDTAISFLDLADGTSNIDHRQRLLANAKKAHDACQRFIPRLTFSASETSIVNRKLRQIRSRLTADGF